MNEHDDREDECDHDECEICGGDHETHYCQETFCRQCFESLDNCDCDYDPRNEIDAEEWIKLGCPRPLSGKDDDE